MTDYQNHEQPGEPCTTDGSAGTLVELHQFASARPGDAASREGASAGIPGGVVLGTFEGWDEEGNPLVDFPGNQLGRSVAARSTVDLGGVNEKAELVLIFAQADHTEPVIMGVIQTPLPEEERIPVEARVDGERVVLSAEREIVLRCGKASITLTRAGKVLIRGAYVLSRSAGVNRVKGGVVHIN